MPDAEDILRALQHGDSFFPSGAVAFSWGLEALRTDDVIKTESDVRAYVEAELRSRWAFVERPVLVATHRAFPDLEAIGRIDYWVETLSLSRSSREGSRRAGMALLGVHKGLATPAAETYYDLVRWDLAPGHLTVVQALVWRAAGLSEAWSTAVSAHSLIVGLLGAALRLGLLSHIASQNCLAAMRNVAAEIAAAPPLALEDAGAFRPQAEIAAMRHETQTVRLFTT